MSNREELDRLIEAAFADKELTPKEMGILIQKAKDLGIKEDEFIIELDARVHKLKEKKKHMKKKAGRGKLLSILNNQIYHRDARYVKEEVIAIKDQSLFKVTYHPPKYVEKYKKARTVRVWHFALPFAIILLIIIVVAVTPNNSKRIKKALIEYNFKKAYEINAKYQSKYSHQQILKVAVPYYIKEGKVNEALSLIDEYEFIYDFPVEDNISYINRLLGEVSNYESEMESYNGEVDFYNDLLLTIANSYVSAGNYQRASVVIETKLRPYADKNGNQTFVPINEKLTFLRLKIKDNLKQ